RRPRPPGDPLEDARRPAAHHHVAGGAVVISLWLGGLLRRRAGRLAATAGGIALAVALIAALGSFLASSQATMTARALRSVAVDWQVEVQPGGDPNIVQNTLRDLPGTAAIHTVH